MFPSGQFRGQGAPFLDGPVLYDRFKFRLQSDADFALFLEVHNCTDSLKAGWTKAVQPRKNRQELTHMKRVLLLCGLLIFGNGYSHAHPGRTDKNGGHTDRKTGTYHYHGGGSSAARSAPIVATTPRRAAPAAPPRVQAPEGPPLPRASESPQYRDVHEPLPDFVFAGDRYPEAVLVKVGPVDGFVKLEIGLVRVKLCELPEPSKSKHCPSAAQKPEMESPVVAKPNQP